MSRQPRQLLGERWRNVLGIAEKPHCPFANRSAAMVKRFCRDGIVESVAHVQRPECFKCEVVIRRNGDELAQGSNGSGITSIGKHTSSFAHEPIIAVA